MPTLTKKGHAQFLDEHTKLVKGRVSALRDMVQMRELGDLSENAGYRAALSKLRRTDNRIRFLEKLLRTSRVVEPPKNAAQHITIGAFVKLHDSDKTFQYSIVDSIESDTLSRKISIRSPLGKALMGKRVGDIVRVSTPQGIRNITVDAITY
jgi:transcription elongation factor GreA